MADGYYKLVCDIIQQLGYRYFANAKGSHEKWKHAESGRMLIVPRNLKSRHTANAILKDAQSTHRL